MAVGRPDKTPYIIYVLSALQAAGGAYLGSQHEDTRAAQAQVALHETRLAVMESMIAQNKARRDEQVQEIEVRLDRLERRR